jgi:geranylgeranyl pyrophosphate synthase
MSATAGNLFRRRRPASWTDGDRPATPGDRRLVAWVDEDRSWGAEWRSSPLGPPVWDQVLLAPIRDILGRPGKSFRANLVRASFALVNDTESPPPQLPAALEILHAGSLIVDDIADQSRERRGGPCVHLTFGIPRALNAGNYMYFWALELLSEVALPPAASRALLRRANRTMLDCHRGQALDLGLVVGGLRRESLVDAATEISSLKTGALMALGAYAGVVAAGADAAQEAAAERFGMRLGIALQKLDDLGNLTSRHAPGKRFEDLRAGRITWAWAWAAEALGARDFAELEARARRVRLAAGAGPPNGLPPSSSPSPSPSPSGAGRTEDVAAVAAVAAILAGPPAAGELTGDRALEAELVSLAEDLSMCVGLHRRGDIRAELAATLADLRAVFGNKPAIRVLARDMERLEASYG